MGLSHNLYLMLISWLACLEEKHVPDRSRLQWLPTVITRLCERRRERERMWTWTTLHLGVWLEGKRHIWIFFLPVTPVSVSTANWRRDWRRKALVILSSILFLESDSWTLRGVVEPVVVGVDPWGCVPAPMGDGVLWNLGDEKSIERLNHFLSFNMKAWRSACWHLGRALDCSQIPHT